MSEISVNSWLFQDAEISNIGEIYGRSKTCTDADPKMIPRPTSVHLDGPDSSVYSFAVQPEGQSACRRCLSKAKRGVIGGLERFFFLYGRLVAKRPMVFIALCIGITLACAAGLAKFTKENTGTKLWIKEDSSSRINTDWLWENYPPDFRFNSMILEADNVLKPDVLQTLYRIRRAVDKIKTKFGDGWKDLCQPLPVVKAPDLASILAIGKRRKRQQQNDDFFGSDSEFFDNFEEEEEDGQLKVSGDQLEFAEYFSAQSYPEPYCGIVKDMEKACFETSILELWGNDGTYDAKTDRDIEALTEAKILDQINSNNKSGIFLVKKSFRELISGLSYDSSGRIVGAKAMIIRWFGRMNGTAAKLSPAADRNEPIDPRMLEFEGDLLKILLNTTGYPEGLVSYANSMRSFGDVASSTILGDVSKLGIGYMIVFVYVMIMLGKFNCVEQRAFLSIAGITGVVMGIVVSYGLCSAMGLFFGPMHQTLPFLLLGIGIDDMFVIVQCFHTLDEEERKLGLPDRFGRAMQHAGVAITITSITDVIAFGIGGTTVLPALRSFCLYASVGIVATYCFQCTFFVAWMALDQRRLEAHRNGCCCCWKHKDWVPNKLSQKSVLNSAFSAYGRVLTRLPVKVAVILSACVVTGFAVWGNLLLEQRFEMTWFLPPETYLANWFVKNKEYFPFGGDRVTVYLYQVDYLSDLSSVQRLVEEIENQTDIVDEVDAWTSSFIKYSNEYLIPKNSREKLPQLPLNQSVFNEMLSQFLFSPRGGKYRERFKFASELKCGQEAPELLLSNIMYTHRLFSGPEEHVPAMNRMKGIIRRANLTGKVFPLSQGYTFWETDEVIAEELYRNLGLAVMCVFFTTWFLISDLLSSLMVLGCVILSLIDVGGFMHFWGLTIDTVSCTMLVIAIGLCVDYSAHIAHRFLVESGSRDERVHLTLTNIGPAVLNGGVTTFLAFILLAGSKSHVFATFFKIFFLVVSFGLFHGLVVLPVILSLAGPAGDSQDYSANEEGDGDDDNDANINVALTSVNQQSNYAETESSCKA